MKILFIHADRMRYEARSRTKIAEELDERNRIREMEEVLVCFITVEKGDSPSGDIAGQACSNIMEVAEKVGTSNIMLYPYAHLSSALAPPDDAMAIMGAIEGELKGHFNVVRAPFGWYKSFTISCKGHPLSELSREIKGASAKERKGEDRYFVFTKEGKVISPTEWKGENDCFSAMLRKEALKEPVGSTASPEYLRLCRKFGISWERMSDVGHEIYHPNGALMFDLSADYASSVVNSIGLSVFTVKGTNMFNLSEPAVREHAELFGDRLYTIDSDNKEFVLRYAACHQQFSMMSGWNISYRQMPVAAFEIADAYRYEQSGETMLLFRLRRLNMPDLHVLCRDMDEAYAWFRRIHGRIYSEIERMGTDYEMLVNVSSEGAFEENRKFIHSLLEERGKDALVHVYPPGTNFYWTVNIEYHMLDRMGRAREIGTVQIDTGNAERFKITYVDAESRRQYPIILHTAIIGTIERFMYAMFDTALMKGERSGRAAYLPFWFTPEQIRLLPVSEKHIGRAMEIASALRRRGFRACVDDREITISKKVREAKQDWVYFMAVVGDRELEKEVFTVYSREMDADRQMTLEELTDAALSLQEGYPSRPLYLPSELSKRVDFSL